MFGRCSLPSVAAAGAGTTGDDILYPPALQSNAGVAILALLTDHAIEAYQPVPLENGKGYG